VIVTIPHGVLRARHESLFTPILPESKIEAIESFGFGTLGKIFLEFPTRLFPEGVTWYQILWTTDDQSKLKGTDKEW
jgi:spermine oxidase